MRLLPPDETGDIPIAPTVKRRARPEAMGGLAKGLMIIESFSARQPHLTVTTAAKAASITPAAARRCLLTLESLGYLSHDGKFFRPTPRMARLGASYNAVSPLPVLAQPFLAIVRDEVGESSSLAVLDGHHVSFIARAESERIVTTSVRLGARLPSYASATGRVLLAALSDDELDEHLRECAPVRTTPNTLVTIREIKARVLEARADGAAFTDEELELGVRTMAVPVRDASGHTHAAISVAALSNRTPMAEMREKFLPILQREAARLGAML